MIGPHGAGLMHCVFMRDRGVLVELPIDGAGANRHFHNLALWSGHKYVQGSDANPVSIDHLKQQLRGLVEGMDLNSY